MTEVLVKEEAKPNGVTTPPADDIILQAKGITKVFPGTVALDHVDFNVYRGKVNVLVGENGAGKSTLMKIIAGVQQATSGQLLLEGKEIQLKSTRDATKHGIGIIFQELNLFPNLSVAENIFMAREIKRAGIVDHAAQVEQSRKLIDRLRQPIEPDEMVSNLRIGHQQIVEIAKALAEDANILIMDEPTSALSTSEVEVLFEVINELKSEGVAIIYISHKLEELLQIGDYVTVLRDGKLRDEKPASEIDIAWIVDQMVGREGASLFPEHNQEVGEEILKVEELVLPRIGGGYTLDHVSFSLHKGEILGIYGLMGAGRSELMECLTGLHPEAEGRVWLEGKELKKRHSVTERISFGLAHIPEDRQREGLVQTMSVANNMLLASLQKYMNGFYLSRKKEDENVAQLTKDLAVKVSDPKQIITSLSGGNQQKVVVAKGLLTDPKILLMDEPTRGIDVGAKSEIFEIMVQLVTRGMGIIFVSSELKEVLAMSDRILVMSKGQITGEFTKENATEKALVAASG